MHTAIVILHVSMMIASLLLMSGAIGLALMGKKTGVSVATFGMIATAVGVVSGVTLLLDGPLNIQCVSLTTYLAAVTVLYYAGFGLGRVENARLIRTS